MKSKRHKCSPKSMAMVAICSPKLGIETRSLAALL